MLTTRRILATGFLVAYFAAVPLLAQDDDSGGGSGSGFPLKYGPKVGGTFNQFQQPGAMLGVAIGGFANYELLDFMAVQLELMYMQQGGGREAYLRDYTAIGGPVNSVVFLNRYVKFHNIEVPLMFKFTLPDHKEGELVPNLLVGVSYGFALAAFEHHDKLYYFGEDAVVDEAMRSNELENVGSNYEQHQFGFNVGFSLDVKLNDGKVFTPEIRYRGGLNDVNLINNGIPANINDVTDITAEGIAGDLYPSSVALFFSLTF
ncbi:MAG: outer membrane beta-barrel protein [Candidatus Cyclobacteriaceae bacterium M3_2C_046]